MPSETPSSHEHIKLELFKCDTFQDTFCIWVQTLNRQAQLRAEADRLGYLRSTDV